jgi:hypothetical protein
MNSPRWHLAGLMLVIVPIALGLSALHSASELCASSLYTLVIVALLTAAFAGIFRRRTLGPPCAGFTLFGFAYLFLSFCPWTWLNPDGLRPPRLVTAVLLQRLHNAKIGPAKEWVEVRDTQPWQTTNLVFGPDDITPELPPSGTRLLSRVVYDISPFKQVAHSILALCAAGFGATLGLLVASRGQTQTNNSVGAG